MRTLLIIGAGIVGLASARAAQQRGWHVTLLDRDFEGDRASHGNAGGIGISEIIPMAVSAFSPQAIKWLLDPLGPLSVRWRHLPAMLPWVRAFQRLQQPGEVSRIAQALAALNRRVYDDLLPLLDDIGLKHALHRRGALTVYETEAAWQADQQDWALRTALGIRWHEVSMDALHALEPALRPAFKRAIMIEDWSHVDDPKAIVEALRQHVRSRQAQLVQGEARELVLADSSRPGVRTEKGHLLQADKVLICAGVWSASLAAQAGDHVLLESERGYNTTLPAATHLLHHEIIFAERKFVATPLAIGLRIGGAAEFASLKAAPDYRRSDALLSLARRYLPPLDETGAQRWMGQRPSTPDSLPVISAATHHPHLLYAFGHGHVGLTQAATTGQLIADMLNAQPTPIDLSPYSISRFRTR